MIVQRAVSLVSRLSCWLASLSTVVCLLLVGASVVARYMFNTPLPWIDKVAGWLVLALVLLVAAGYLLWSPIQLYPPQGFPIKCGSGAAPPDNELGTAACGSVNVIRQWQAGGLAAAAVLGGMLLARRIR